MKRFTRKYRIEIIAVIVVVIGAILVLDLSPILTTANRIVVLVFGRLTPAAAIGLVLLVGALVFIGWRLRVRFLRSPVWRVSECPRCGSPIHRVRRTWLDRVASTLVLPHARRYRCSNSDCGWEGLRHSRRTDSQAVK
jgi:hypothetical protein